MPWACSFQDLDQYHQINDISPKVIFLLFFPLLNALFCPKFKLKEAKNPEEPLEDLLQETCFLSIVPGGHSFVCTAIGAKQLQNLTFWRRSSSW